MLVCTSNPSWICSQGRIFNLQGFSSHHLTGAVSTDCLYYNLACSINIQMGYLLRALTLTLLLAVALSAYCNGKPGTPHVNSLPIWNGQPRLLKSSTYGKLYEIGENTTTMKLLHVYGNMYQMGLAHGVLLKEELNSFMTELWKYIQDQIVDAIPKKIPKMLRPVLSQKLINLALDLTYYATKMYTNKKYYQEIKGISDGSGVPFALLRRLHMIGQITKGHCSMFGAWGNATLNHETVQLRALDWDFDGPYRKYPLAVVYHPSSKKDGNTWMNIGFVGWVGVISGISEEQMAISEIGVSYPDETFGKQSRIGNPFTFILRDVLQFDHSLNDTINRFQKAKRTCNLILGVGDGKAGYFRGFQYGHSVLNVIDDANPRPSNDSWHPAVPNTVYWGMDWMCPPFHQRLGELLASNSGNITAQSTVRSILPSLTSGNLQTVIYDLTNQTVHFAYGMVTEDKKEVNAYDRPYIRLDMKQVFAQAY